MNNSIYLPGVGGGGVTKGATGSGGCGKAAE